MAPKIEYRRRSNEEMEKAAAKPRSEGIVAAEFTVFRPVKGENYIRILQPTWPNAKHWGYDLFVHYGIGPDRQHFLCLFKMLNKPCPICNSRAKLEGRSGSKDEIKQLRWKHRRGVWLLDRNTEKDEDKGAQFWAMPESLSEDIQKISRDRRTNEWYYIDDPEAGYEVSFIVEGERELTKYTAPALGRHQTSLPGFESFDRPGELMLFIAEHPIPDVLVYHTYDEIQAIFEGRRAGEEESDDRPTRATTTDARSARPERDTRPSATRPDREDTRETRPERDAPSESRTTREPEPTRSESPRRELMTDRAPETSRVRLADTAREVQSTGPQPTREVAADDPPFDPQPNNQPATTRLPLKERAARVRDIYADRQRTT